MSPFAAPGRHLWLPALFVVLWASGYPACKASVLHASASTVLFLRYAGAIMVLLVVALVAHARWPSGLRQWGHLAVAGVLIHGIYLGINFAAAARGFPVGITALIGALQPLLTAVIAGVFLHERVSQRQWLGLLLGLGGVLMVLTDRVAFDWSHPVQAAWVTVALVAMTAGTLYQKRFCAFMDWRTGVTVQMMLPCAFMLVAAFFDRPRGVDAAPAFFAGIAWLVVLSSGMYGILHVLFLRGESAQAASLFYLVPVVTSSFMYLMFGERLGPLALAGIVVVVAGVLFATSRTPARAAAR